MMRLNRFLRRTYVRACFAVGLFDGMKCIQPERIDRLVFVCRGNVCRSAYAEAAAKSLGFQASSCGIDVIRSAPAEPMAVRAALLRGKDLNRHMSRSIFDTPIASADCLVAMEPSHVPAARDVATSNGCQITLLGLWMERSVPIIEDPYGKPLQDFTKCFGEIDQALIGLVEGMEKSRG
jgi:protein-tyrosine phosphatase